METATGVTVDSAVADSALVEEIFAKDTWTQDDCRQLYAALFNVTNGADKFRGFANRTLAAAPDPSGAAAVKAGLIHYMLGNFAEAASALAAGTDNRDRRWHQGLCYRKMELYSKAIDEFTLAADRGWDEAEAKVAVAQCQCLAGDTAAAEKAVEQLASNTGLSEYFVLRGLVAEAASDYDSAEEAYGEALELDPKSQSALFRLAFLYDMHGDEDQAVDLYAQCLETPPVNTNAAINLSVLYEDAGRWDDAEHALTSVLSVQPNHERAKLYDRDVTGSRSMYYDEDQERRTVQHNAVLDIPVTDFELSVRARNCLKKMDIHTLGDLLRVTEADLLGSKNFGETSLIEIKTMLSQKGLQLGQEVDPTPSLPSAIIPAEGQAASDSHGILGKPVAELELSVRARKTLERLGLATVGDLTSKAESELLTCKNFGQTSLNEIKQRLGELGLSLRGR